MGRLTEDLTRLRGEMRNAKACRAEFVSELKRNVANLRHKFAADLAEMRSGVESALSHMARNGKACRAEFVSGLKRNVAEMRSGHRAAISELKRNVADLLHEYAAEFKSAHQAWYGAGAPAREGNGSSRSGN